MVNVDYFLDVIRVLLKIIITHFNIFGFEGPDKLFKFRLIIHEVKMVEKTNLQFQ
jgi:hypothetical protein